MANSRILAFALAGTLGCSGVTDPEQPESTTWPPIDSLPMPAIEGVDWAALGERRIAFHRTTPGVSGLYVVDGRSRTATDHLGGSFLGNPRLSPDGSWVAFEAPSGFGSNTSWDIYVSRLDGSDLLSVSPLEGNTEGPPAWSPAGDSVLFAWGFSSASVYRVSARGGPRTTVWTAPADHTAVGSDIQIALWEDGALAVVDRWAVFVDDELVYEPPQGSDRPLTRAPVWSSDGASLHFLEVRWERRNGYLLPSKVAVKQLDLTTGLDTELAVVDGELNAPYSSLPANESFTACLSADGELLFFTAPTDSGYSVFATPLAGGDAIRITTPPAGMSDSSLSCL